ncbi:MAG: arylamine N-acetyltransferase family protein [Nannocystales bacterium]
MSVGVDAYLERIGYRGSRDPNLAVLHNLCEAHVRAIPFENLDVLLQRPMPLELVALEDKLVRRRRGGYCFEHHTLLCAVLQTLGYDARILAARARIGASRDEMAAPTHAFVGVDLDGETWLADVGIGRASSSAALRFTLDEEQPTPHEPRRITRFGDDYMHEAKLGDRWEDVAQFSMRPMPRIDREVAHWYTSTHPDSTFRRSLMAARAASDGGRVTLRNGRLQVRRGADVAESQVDDGPGLQAVLLEHFDIELEDETAASLAVRFAGPAGG